MLWKHDFENEPVLIYSEIGDDGYESRKVEVYRDGRHDFADEGGSSSGSTVLGEKPVPDLQSIADQGEFSPELIDLEEFERVWSRAHR
ncbi:DUF6881 domain-containing protein [Allokutzneria albata]|uniref:DUF6881 domain-containing protein n=1 Tax=Allokutzneria albata TaxID=211114 RepID=UPI001E4FC513|nr:hypothetical protein [Allokutzneria albata]